LRLKKEAANQQLTSITVRERFTKARVLLPYGTQTKELSMAIPERDTVYTNDGTNKSVYTRESSSTGWFVGIIVALALLAIGYLVFSANSGPSTTVDSNTTTLEAPITDPAAPAPMTEAPAVTEPAPATEAPATDVAPMTEAPAATEAAPAETAPATEAPVTEPAAPVTEPAPVTTSP
jgi:hypothetical protein